MDYAGPGSALGNGPLQILSGSLQGSGEVAGGLMIHPEGVLSPGGSIGTLSIAADLTLAGTLEIEVNGENDGTTDFLNGVQHLTLSDGSKIDFSVLGLDPLDDLAYIFANYNTLTGTFTSVANLPTGYKIDYEFEGNQIALVPVPEPTVLAILLGLAATILARRRCRCGLV